MRGCGFSWQCPSASVPAHSHASAMLEHAADAPNCLPGALFVLDQGEAHVAVAVVAEADAGADGDLRLAQQLLGEFQRAERR